MPCRNAGRHGLTASYDTCLATLSATSGGATEPVAVAPNARAHDDAVQHALTSMLGDDDFFERKHSEAVLLRELGSTTRPSQALPGALTSMQANDPLAIPTLPTSHTPRRMACCAGHRVPGFFSRTFLKLQVSSRSQCKRPGQAPRQHDQFTVGAWPVAVPVGAATTLAPDLMQLARLRLPLLGGFFLLRWPCACLHRPLRSQHFCGAGLKAALVLFSSTCDGGGGRERTAHLDPNLLGGLGVASGSCARMSASGWQASAGSALHGHCEDPPPAGPALRGGAADCGEARGGGTHNPRSTSRRLHSRGGTTAGPLR